jgi:hypothetical protein
MTEKIKADAAILIDVAYLDKTGTGLSNFFSNHVLGRELPKADFGRFINSIAFQMGFEPGKHTFFVYLVAHENNAGFDFCVPSNLQSEFNERGYEDTLGEFIFWVVPVMNITPCGNVVLEVSQYVCEEEELPVVGIIANLEECDDFNVEGLTSAIEKKSIRVEAFSMNHQDEVKFPEFQHQELGHALLNAMGVRPEELA